MARLQAEGKTTTIKYMTCMVEGRKCLESVARGGTSGRRRITIMPRRKKQSTCVAGKIMSH